MGNTPCRKPSVSWRRRASRCGSIEEDGDGMTTATSAAKWLNKVKWDEQGLVPVIAQEASTGEVLMFAWMNRDARARTVELRQAVYWSRSRKKLWHKGEESGNFQTVLDMRLDC